LRPHLINPTAGSDKPMVSTKALKMKIIPVEKPPKSIFMKLAEVIGFSEGVVSQFPIESLGDGGFARKLMARCGEGAEFFSEVIAK
jgi:hypothetical protein